MNTVQFFDPTDEIDYSSELWSDYSDVFKGVEGFRPRWAHTWQDVATYMWHLPQTLEQQREQEEWEDFLDSLTGPEELPLTEGEYLQHCYDMGDAE